MVSDHRHTDLLQASAPMNVLSTCPLDREADATPRYHYGDFAFGIGDWKGQGALFLEGARTQNVSAVGLEHILRLRQRQLIRLFNFAALIEEPMISGNNDMGAVEGVANALD